ncbi:NAD(P)/FAD-dependent oxidoreductase [Haloferula sp. A504]|uniref:NAD(P)/FAD-dependent oxidoreductase n=1 Tax=Haloferula sp. A504 TaxID=3373601 RepID=UPI0031BF2D93|nr:NAD(P)/FAD-dependent oxidoreductase [Verrucomicrobiaceae bacterium E54]
MRSYDVVIVGASVSGASLAACLGKAGLAVALVDKASFPRRKACGEGLSNVALAALGRMGFEMGDVVDSGLPYYAYRIDLEGRSHEFATGRERRLRGIGMQRTLLDQALLDQASRLPAVSSICGVAVSGVREDPEGYVVSLSTGQTLRGRHLVLADGASSPCGRMLGIPVHRKANPLWGMSFILEGSFSRFAGEVVVILKEGFEVNCTPVSPSRLNVTFLAKREKVRALQDPRLRARLLAEAKEKSCFTGQAMGKPLQVGPVGTARRGYAHGSVMLVGDAAENLDPIAGMGMTHGILMAEMAAESLIPVCRDGVESGPSLARYAGRAGRMGRSYRGFTRLTASVLRSPARRVLLPALSATFLPGVIRSSLDEDSTWESHAPAFPKRILSLAGV